MRNEYRDRQQERQSRIDLAAAFRLAALEGWNDMLTQHISVRVPGEKEQYLIQPPHLMFEEVTASNLHLLDGDGRHVRPSTEGTHAFSFPMHRAVYRAVPEAGCVMHLHTKASVAVAMQQQGLIPGNQYALWIGKVGYHDYEGFLTGPEEEKRLSAVFKQAKVVILRAHGMIVWGRSVHEAYLLCYYLNRACEAQVASNAGAVPAYTPPQWVIDKVPGEASITTDGNASYPKMCWEALLRKLDRQAPDFRN